MRLDGSVTTTCVPSPSALSKRDRAAVLLDRARARSRARGPVPGIASRVAVDARKKRENTCPCSSHGTPMPVSATTRRTPPPSALMLTRHLAAVVRELDRVRDEIVEHLRQPVAVARHDRRMIGHAARASTPLSSAAGRIASTARDVSSATSTGASCSSTRLASICAISSRSSTSACSRSVLRRITSR